MRTTATATLNNDDGYDDDGDDNDADADADASGGGGGGDDDYDNKIGDVVSEKNDNSEHNDNVLRPLSTFVLLHSRKTNTKLQILISS